MTTLARLYDAEIVNGNLIYAEYIKAELDQLVSSNNNQEGRIDDIETGDITIAGVKTFTSAPKTNTISERSAGNGVTIDGVLCKDGAVQVDMASDLSSPSDGFVWYNTTSDKLKVRQNGSSENIATETYVNDNAGLPNNYYSWDAPEYASASTITIGYFYGKDSTNTVAIDVGSETVNITTSGLNGLATDATETVSTKYYCYAVVDSLSATANKTPGYMLSPKNVAGGDTLTGLPNNDSALLTGTVSTTSGDDQIAGVSTTFLTDFAVGQKIVITDGDTLTIQSVDSDTAMTATANATTAVSGKTYLRRVPYDKYRQLKFVVFNDASSNFIPFYMDQNTGSPSYFFRDFETTSTYRVLNSFSTASFTAQSLAALVPAISRQAYLQPVATYASDGRDYYIRATGSGLSTGIYLTTSNAHGVYAQGPFRTDASQSIDVRANVTGGSTLALYVRGFVIDQI